jgi:potassium intermediate/small conductance calcium-activated channel subfamily N protein 2
MSNSHIPIVNESSQNNLNFPPELLPNGIPNSVLKLNEKKEEKNIESPNLSQTTKSLGRRFSITQLTDSKMLFLSNYLKNEQNLEDEHLTEEYFNTVFIDEMISTLFVALSIGSGIIYYETRTCSEIKCNEFGYFDKVINISLISVSIGVIGFILTMIPRYIHLFYLYRSAKYISSIDNFFQSGLLPVLIFDFIFAFIHPNLIFKDKYVTTGKKWNLLEVKYNVNDFLLSIMLFRSFYFVKFFILCSNYHGARADRICKMMGKQSSYIFSFKCLLISKTLKTLIFITLLVCLTLSYMLKVIEGPVYKVLGGENNTNNYMQYINCFWNVLVTMTTVGYGDYFPVSILGRFVGFIIAISGTVIVALNINFFQSTTELGDDEKRTLDFILRLEEGDKIKNLAVSYFKNNFQYVITKRKYFKGEIPNTNDQKKIMIQKARDKFFYRRKYKEVVHRFQIKYKMAVDVDMVKKKIRFLDDTVINLGEKLQTLNDRIEKYFTKQEEVVN